MDTSRECIATCVPPPCRLPENGPEASNEVAEGKDVAEKDSDEDRGKKTYESDEGRLTVDTQGPW